MDIYQRTCKREVVHDDLRSNEIEILEAESSEEAAEEEEAELEEPLDLKALQLELDNMKRRILVLQLRLKMMLAERPDEECVNYEIELSCSENKEICALQKNQHKLQCQINELIRCCKFAKEQIADLRQRMCDKNREILQLQKNVAMLITWRNTLEHEYGVCIERFEYLKHVKAEWMDVATLMEKHKMCMDKMEKKFVPKKCFVDEKKDFIREINDLKDLFKDLFELQTERFHQLEQRINNSIGVRVMLGPSEHTEEIEKIEMDIEVHSS